MRSTRLLPLLFALIPAACGDDIIFPDQVEVPDPALNGVFPSKGFTDRALRVEISGDGTEFSGTPTVSFGADITVVSVELSSPSTLFANITIAGAAAVGKRDVTVTNGAEALTLTAAFDVQNPLEVITLGPSLQWGRNQMLIINHDPESPFLGNLEATAGTGVTIVLDPDFQTESIAFGDVFIDDNGATGAVVVNDTLLDTVVSRGGVLEITPRTPTPLTAPGKGPDFQVLNATLTNTTEVFSYTTTAPGFWRTTTSVDGAGLAPTTFLLPTGKWAAAVGGAPDDLALLANGATVNLVIFDDFSTGTVFDLAADLFHDTTGAVALAEVEPNDEVDNPGDGQVVPAGQDVTLFTGALNADDTGFDDLSFTLVAGDQIHITSDTTANGADTVAFVFDSEFNVVDGNSTETDSFCCGDISGLAIGDDINEATGLFASDVTTVQLPAGTYFVEFVDSFFFAVGFQPFNDVPYNAAITVIHNTPQ